MQVFNFFGSILGYLLWFLYCIFKNYGVAIILFTIILKALMFPFSLKQQKSMAKQAKLSEKMNEIKKRCGTDKVKYNEEVQKIYEKEGVNPSSGCLTTLIPFPIMLGIYYSVIFPLQNTLHIAANTVTKATEFMARIPGVSSLGNYVELEVVKNWQYLSSNEAFRSIFSYSDIEKIDSFTKGFSFAGLDLLNTPQGSTFGEFLWLIPVLCLLSYWASTFLMNKASGVKQQGCMNVMMYAMPLLSAYWSYIMPAAVGFYWVITSVIGGVQSYITTKYFSVNHMTAMNEAQHFVSMQLSEESVRPLPANMQREIADKLTAQSSQLSAEKKNAKPGAKKKGKGAAGKSSNDYLGNKK